MMKRKNFIDKFKLGIFVAGGVLIFTVFIFYIGSNNYKFGSSGKKIKVTFKNVSGLRHGSIIRYSGVNIGTVDEIAIVADSSVLVSMVIEGKSSAFVKKDSKARISTEGMLGNRFVSISGGSENSPSVQDGDKLESVEPMDFDKLLGTLDETGTNTKNMTNNLNNITKKIDNGEGTLGALISDKAILHQAENMLASFQQAGNQTNLLAIKMALLADSITIVGSNAIKVSENLVAFTGKLNNDSSSLGKAITDTAMAKRVDRALIEVSTAAEDIKLTSGKIRENWFIRHFGKKPNKKQK
jgi:phospholipid/cholesterol/gamma-HCH transport system substrate-binding protein